MKISTTGADRKMIEAWAALHLPAGNAEAGRADRLAADALMIRRALALELPSSTPWSDHVAIRLLP
jgi:hypothetical protein